jgi:cytochrome c oxidase subunit I
MKTVSQPSGRFNILWDYLTTVDHKKVGILYLISGGFFFLIGGLEVMLMRIQLTVPNNDFLSAGLYNELLTMHGTTMIFLAAMPLLFGFMNAIVPLQIGSRDVAFPFLNALGFWLFLFGGLLLNCSWFLGGAPDAGWTSYASLAMESPSHGVDFYALGLQISGFGTLIAGINFIVTIINMRAPGMTYMRMPLFTWSSFVTSSLILFAFPPFTVALFLLTFDRLYGGNFFDPAAGGNTVIWEHLFWIFGHPEVYILVLPAFGIFSEVLSTFSMKRLFGYSSMVFATVLIGFLGFMVWLHHMFTTGAGPIANAIFSVSTMAIAVPTGIKIFNWMFTLWGSSIRFSSSLLWALGFIPTFTFGGATGVMLASAAADYQLHDSYFVVGHFHYVIIGGVVFSIFAALHYWWPKIFGRMLDEWLGKITFWFFFIGFQLAFFFYHFLGLYGMPRRVFTYLPGQGFETYNLISTIGALLMTIAALVFIYNVVVTTIRKQPVDNDPWNARSLEWAISSPPPEYNFKQLPLVRGLDPFWLEKMNDKKEMLHAEPISDIHMPNSSILPFLISLGLFIASFGIIFREEGILFLTFIGLGTTIISMLIRSIKDDHGYHILIKDLQN